MVSPGKTLNLLFKRLRSRIRSRGGSRFGRNGAVLIEFAGAIPVLIIVLYFSLDVPTAYRISAKLQRTSELYATMLANVAKNQKSKVSYTDLKNISRSIGLTFVGIYSAANKKCPFNLSTYIVEVKGTGTNNNFSIQKCLHVQNNMQTGTEDSPTVSCALDTSYSYSKIASNSATHPGKLASLQIQKDEVKLLVETVAWYNDTSRGFNSSLYLMTIPGVSKGSGANSAKTLGDRTAIITPPEGFQITTN